MNCTLGERRRQLWFLDIIPDNCYSQVEVSKRFNVDGMACALILNLSVMLVAR
jgi:hypothetical protein